MTPAYILSFLLGALGALAVSRFATGIGLLDRPNERSSHCTPTPKGGGIGICAALISSCLVVRIPIAVWLPLTALALLGFWGDRRSLSPLFRLFGQFVFIALFIVISEHSRDNFLWYLTSLPLWILFIVGTANLYNFMDGINGIAGITGVIGFALLSLYSFLKEGYGPSFTLSACMALSCLGFLPLNMPEARVFMGDVGSILLGAVFGGFVFLQTDTLLDFICMASFLSPFYADELATMAVRIKDGESLIRPHRRHLYQLLANEYGIAHWKISVCYSLLQLAIGLSVLLIRHLGLLPVIATLIAYFSIFSGVSFFVRKRVPMSLRE